MSIEEVIHVYENSRLVAESFTEEAVTAAYVEGLAALRAQQEREKNEPLTLDELREMDGEPVWVVDGEGNELWGLTDTTNGNPDVFDSQYGLWQGEFYNMGGDGKNGLNPIGWLAYRRKPKEETK